MDSTLIVILRLIHIVLGAFWVGGAVTTAFFILPTVKALGPVGGQFAAALMQRTHLPTVLAGVGVVMALAGIALYWLIYAGSPMTGTTIVLSIGGAIGIIVLVVGFALTKPAADKLGALAMAIASQGSPPTPAQAAERERLSTRMRNGATINAVLLLVAVACMAIARYV